MKGSKFFVKTIVFLSALAGLTFSPLQASDLSYSYAEAYYIPTIEGAEDGFKFEGSYRLMSNLYVGGRYGQASRKYLDVDSLGAFAGYIHPLNENWDVNLEFSIYKIDFDYDKRVAYKDDDDVGIAITGKVRGMVTSQLEVYSELEWSFDDAGKSKDDESDDSEITIGAKYYLMPNLAAGIEAGLYAESLGFGVTFAF